MEELIKELRERANENIQYGQDPNAKDWGDEEGIVISNAEALQIAAALEAATSPAIVRMALAFLEIHETNCSWFCINIAGHAYEYFSRPKLHNERNIWYSDAQDGIRVDNFKAYRQPEYFTLLFHRTETGWIWVHKPSQV